MFSTSFRKQPRENNENKGTLDSFIDHKNLHSLHRVKKRNISFNFLYAALCHFVFAYFACCQPQRSLTPTNSLYFQPQIPLHNPAFGPSPPYICRSASFFRHLLLVQSAFCSLRAVLFWHFRSARMFRFEDRRQKLEVFFFFTFLSATALFTRYKLHHHLCVSNELQKHDY